MEPLSEAPSSSFCEVTHQRIPYDRSAAGIESNGLLSFHLGKLKDLVKLNSKGAYALTDGGKHCA